MNGPMSVKWTIAGKEIYIQQCFTLVSVLFIRRDLDSILCPIERILYANRQTHPKSRLWKKTLGKLSYLAKNLNHNPFKDFLFWFNFCQAMPGATQMSLGWQYTYVGPRRIFDKPEITNFRPLQEFENKGIDNVKIEHCPTFEMPKKVFSSSFTKI